MPQTKTSHKSSFHRPPPISTTFSFPSPDSGNALTFPPTIITIHIGSTYSTQTHWHTTHTEYIRVTSGAALISVSGVSKIFTAADGVAQVPRYARHEWMRFDRPALLLNKGQREAQEAYFQVHGKENLEKLANEDLVAEEWTDPADGQKEVFFRNIFSTSLEPYYESDINVLGEVWRMLQIMCVMWELDNYPVLVDLGGWKGGWRAWVEAGWTYAVMGCLVTLGRLFGCRAVYEEYTPRYLLEKCKIGPWKSE